MEDVPERLTHTSARVLEFDALLQLLRGYAVSPLGQARVESLAPTADRDWIERQQRLTAEVRQFLRAGGRFDFSGLLDPGMLLDKARIEGVALEATVIRDILLVVDRADEWKAIAKEPPSAMRGPEDLAGRGRPASITSSTSSSPWPAVAELSAGIEDFTDLLRSMRNKILPDGTLDDRASPELAQIRREVEKQKRAIQESLHSYLRRLAEGGAVQEELVTIRGERFVIPVKTEQKRRVQGVVHGASSSGQTVFVEPLETIEQNNELVRLMEEEQAEVHRILLQMTQKIAERAPAIQRAVEILAELELQFAKARFAEEYNCVSVQFLVSSFQFPEKKQPLISVKHANQIEQEKDQRSSAGSAVSSSDGNLVLMKARHPLLERNLRASKKEVVPVTVELTGEQRQLVITGPNTGGKTVTLKTVGLLALMGQAGMPVPADRAAMPVFDAVLADIGDYQSIEQNLSTFSAHVTNIDFLSRTATHDSLVLLDELGSATDPEEGAALAVAIADHFRSVGAVSIISTHHTSLKVYGANTPAVLNAAVGFDERTLQPTYELKLGVPGASAGINIAQRLGLNGTVIEAARSRLTSQTQDVARFLDRLHSELRQAEAERTDIKRREQEVAREKSRLAAEGMKEQRQHIKELEGKLDGLLRDFEYRARETVNAVQERAAALKLSKDAERRLAKMRREFREQFNNAVVAHTTGADKGDPHARPELVANVLEGDTVKLRSLGRTALVKRTLGGDQFEVVVGAMTMKIPRSDVAEVVARVSDSPLKAARAKGISVSLGQDDLGTATEINVIGRNVDEATREVEKFVDRAFLAGMPRVRIVHGSGMGILRKALREYLKSHPHVATVAEAPQNEGGGGATVVELRV